ncbi:MAG: hypothetical protein ACTSUE_01650 [Promethearchaeota archaeon]
MKLLSSLILVPVLTRYQVGAVGIPQLSCRSGPHKFIVIRVREVHQRHAALDFIEHTREWQPVIGVLVDDDVPSWHFTRTPARSKATTPTWCRKSSMMVALSPRHAEEAIKQVPLDDCITGGITREWFDWFHELARDEKEALISYLFHSGQITYEQRRMYSRRCRKFAPNEKA